MTKPETPTTAAGGSPLERGVRPHVWVVEWGAISLPLGAPSRITAMLAHHTKEEAEQALAEVSEEFNAHMWLAGDLDAERERCAKALEHFAAVAEERGGTDLGAALRDMAELCRRLGLGPNAGNEATETAQPAQPERLRVTRR